MSDRVWKKAEKYYYVEFWNEGYGVACSFICDSDSRCHPNRFKTKEEAKRYLKAILQILELAK